RSRQPGGPSDAPGEAARGREPRGTRGGPQREGRRASFGSLQNPAYRPAPPFDLLACYGRRMRKRLMVAGVVLVAGGGLTLGLLLAGVGSTTQHPGVVATSAPLHDVRGRSVAWSPLSPSCYRGRVLVLSCL